MRLTYDKQWNEYLDLTISIQTITFPTDHIYHYQVDYIAGLQKGIRIGEFTVDTNQIRFSTETQKPIKVLPMVDGRIRFLTKMQAKIHLGSTDRSHKGSIASIRVIEYWRTWFLFLLCPRVVSEKYFTLPNLYSQ